MSGRRIYNPPQVPTCQPTLFALQEIEVAAQVGLGDVIEEELAVPACVVRRGGLEQRPSGGAISSSVM